jgi:aminoglycoside phosphotransferase (APT) family kinase protein
MTAESTDTSSAPKFHVDRSTYGPALQSWMSKQLPDATGVTVDDIDIPVATGFSNETVFFTAGWTAHNSAHRQRFVARIEPADSGLFPTQTPACAVSVGLQHRIMETVARHSPVPIPPLLPFEPDPTFLGQPFFVMGFIDGVIPADTPRYTEAGFMVTEATPDERHRMVASGLEAMGQLHAIDWVDAGLGWLDPTSDAQPTIAHQLRIYRDFATELLGERSHPVLAAALNWLDNNDPGDDRIGLSWGDARLANMIWQDYRPAAVIDWEACALSPTEADLGWWLMFDRMSFDDIGADRMEGYPTREEQVDLYQEASGREVRDPHYWEVFATMRFAAIFIRLGDRMVSSGLIPEALNPAVGNAVTAALASLMGISNPTPDVLAR